MKKAVKFAPRDRFYSRTAWPGMSERVADYNAWRRKVFGRLGSRNDTGAEIFGTVGNPAACKRVEAVFPLNFPQGGLVKL
jgi:hypothetical protein